MASVQTRDGRQLDVTWNSDRHFLHLQRKWAREEPQRIRQLAALTLHANGWTMEMIAEALGWKARGHAARIVKNTKSALQVHFHDLNAERRQRAEAAESLHLDV